MVGQVGSLALVARLRVLADEKPRPAVERAVLHRRGVLEGRVVTQAVTLVDHRPELAAPRLDRDARRVAQPGGDDLAVLPLRRVREDEGAVLFAVPRLAQGTRLLPPLQPA